MHRPHWQKVAILFSAAWIVVVGVSTGVYAYHQFACKPTVELLADGTIIRHACIVTALAWRTIAEMAGYLIGGVVVVSLLSWIFLGWPSDADGWGGLLSTGPARLDAKRQSKPLAGTKANDATHARAMRH